MLTCATLTVLQCYMQAEKPKETSKEWHKRHYSDPNDIYTHIKQIPSHKNIIHIELNKIRVAWRRIWSQLNMAWASKWIISEKNENLQTFTEPRIPQWCLVKIHRQKSAAQRQAGESSLFKNIVGNIVNAVTASVRFINPAFWWEQHCFYSSGTPRTYIVDLFSSSPEGRSIALPPKKKQKKKQNCTATSSGYILWNCYKSWDKKSLVMENMQLTDI